MVCVYVCVSCACWSYSLNIPEAVYLGIVEPRRLQLYVYLFSVFRAVEMDVAMSLLIVIIARDWSIRQKRAQTPT